MFSKTFFAAAALAAGTPAMALDLPVGGARFQIPVVSMKAARFHRTFKQQYDFSCGSAALATLLTFHYGDAISEQQVFKQMFQHGDQGKIRREGFSLLDMQRFLAMRGLRADGFRVPLDRLAQARLPALVLIAENGYRHFVVLKGVRDGRALLGDPSRGMRVIAVADFRRIWVGNLLFVIHGYGNALVQFNDDSDWQMAPAAPLSAAMPRDSLQHLIIPRLGPGDF